MNLLVKVVGFCDFGAFLLGPNLRVPAAFAGAVKCFPLVSWEGNLNLLAIGAVTKNLDAVSSPAEDLR